MCSRIITVTGSPGTTFSMKKMMNVMPIRTGMEMSRRLRMNFAI